MTHTPVGPIVRLEPPAESHSVAHAAMATEFVFWLSGHDAGYLESAAAEAFSLIDEIESRLSLYREGSDVARINLAPPGEQVHVSDETLRCLLLSRKAAVRTGGAFNVFTGGLNIRKKSRDHDLPIHVLEALDRCGRAPVDPVVEIDADTPVVRRIHADGLLDFGAIGKGFALDEAASLLGQWDVHQGVLIAGGSSILVLDPPSGTTGLGWEISPDCGGGIAAATPPFLLARVALGASGLGFNGEHIVDPRDPAAPPIRMRTLAAAGFAAWADALSTAAMMLTDDQLAGIAESPLDPVSFLASPEVNSGDRSWRSFGSWFINGTFAR